MRIRIVIPFILLLILSTCISSALPPALPEDWELVWSDEFTGTTLDASKWEHAPEWKRRANQWWSDQDAYLDGTNNLVLRMRRDNDSIFAGAIRTRRDWPFDGQILFDRTYGYFEIRATFPVIPDAWGAFWMLPSAGDPYAVTNGSQGTEIDIFETIHSAKGWINHAIYWGTYGASKDVNNMPDLYEGYHTVGLLWTKNEYRFYVDDVETWRTTANDGVMQVPAYLKITMEANPGAYEHLAIPKTMLVDYVRVYAPAPAATVTLNNLTQTYNGSAQVVTATTEPLGLTVDITYDGNAWAPTNAGTYAVTGAVNDVMYNGAATGTLIVSKGSQTITGFTPMNGAAFVTTNTAGLAATASSGLSVTNFVVVLGPGVISGLTNLIFTNSGAVNVTTDQAGDDNWNPAPIVMNTYVVTATYDKPSLSGTIASNIMAHMASLGGNVMATNGYPVTERGVFWGTDSGTLIADGTKCSESGKFDIGDFSFYVTNLPAGRTNYFLAYAVNEVGTNFTAERSFLTRPAAPEISAPTNITANALYANWQSTENSTNYLLDVAATNDFIEYLAGYSNRVVGTELTFIVTGLQARVVYYYRVRSENATGVSTNSDVMTVADGVIGLLPTSLSYAGVYGGINPVVQSFVVTNSGYWDFNFTNSAEYSSGATGWWTATPATGSLAGASFLTMAGSVDVTAMNAGTYYVTNTVISAEAVNSPQDLTVTLIVDKAGQTITGFTPTNGSVFVVTNMAELNATGGGSTNPVIFTVISGPGVLSEQTNLTFTNSGTVHVSAYQAGDTNWNAAPTVTNTFSVLLTPIPPVQDGWVAIQVTPANGTWQLTTPAGYTGPISGIGNLTAISAPTGLYSLAWGALADYVVPDNQSQLVTGGSTTLFAGVYLLASTNIGTPSVSATEGTYTNKVRITWQSVPDVTGYEIWKSQSSNVNMAVRIVEVPDYGAASFLYDDYDVMPPRTYYYWGLAKKAAQASALGPMTMGYARLVPDLDVPVADIIASDMVYLPVNVTNLSTAGTVSFRLGNLGPDPMEFAEVAFDFRIGLAVEDMLLLGSDQRAFSLAAGQEELVILTAQAKRGLVVPPTLEGVKQVQVTVRHASALVDPNLANNTTTAAGTVLVRPAGINSPGRTRTDYDGDGKADPMVLGAARNWFIHMASGERYAYQNWVATGVSDNRYQPALGDYDGDGITDLGLYEEVTGIFYARLSSSGATVSGPAFGGVEYIPVVGDYDGDGKSDPALYNPSTGHWLVQLSAHGYTENTTWFHGPHSHYMPVHGDYDGDGLTDPAAYSTTSSMLTARLSSQNYSEVELLLGGLGCVGLRGDFDGDGMADPAVYHEASGTWQGLLSNYGQGHIPMQGVFGGPGWTAVPNDYDGDGRTDPALYYNAELWNPLGRYEGYWCGLFSSLNYAMLWGWFAGPGYEQVTE